MAKNEADDMLYVNTPDLKDEKTQLGTWDYLLNRAFSACNNSQSLEMDSKGILN